MNTKKFFFVIFLHTLTSNFANAAWYSVEFPDANAKCTALDNGIEPEQAVSATTKEKTRVEISRLPDGATKQIVRAGGRSYRFASMFGSCMALASMVDQGAAPMQTERTTFLQCNFSGGGIVNVNINYTKHKVDVGGGSRNAEFDDNRIRWFDPFYGQMTLERESGQLLMMVRSGIVRGLCVKSSTGNKF